MDRIGSGAPHSPSRLVNQTRRDRGSVIQAQHLRVPPGNAIEPGRVPRGLSVVGVHPLDGPRAVDLLRLGNVVVEFQVELLPRVGETKAEPILGAFRAADPAVTRGVEALADFIVVRGRHDTEDLGDIAGRIHAFTVGIPRRALHNRVGTVGLGRIARQRAEHAGIAELSCKCAAVRIFRGRLWIAKEVHNRRARRGARDIDLLSIAVAPVVKVAKDTARGAGREHGGVHFGAAQRNEAVPKAEEKCFVPDDGTGQARGILVDVGPGTCRRCGLHAVVGPGIAI